MTRRLYRLDFDTPSWTSRQYLFGTADAALLLAEAIYYEEHCASFTISLFKRGKWRTVTTSRRNYHV